MSSNACRYCGAEILYRDTLGWHHAWSGSSWCDASATTRATP